MANGSILRPFAILAHGETAVAAFTRTYGDPLLLQSFCLRTDDLEVANGTHKESKTFTRIFLHQPVRLISVERVTARLSQDPPMVLTSLSSLHSSGFPANSPKADHGKPMAGTALYTFISGLGMLNGNETNSKY